MTLPTPTPPWSVILLDLDGTIADSAPGILDSLEHMFRTMGRPVPNRTELMRWVGPPILESFRDLAGMDAPTSQRALAIYREHYLGRGAAESTMFEGIPELIKGIRAAGIPLSLATSKPEGPATLILEKFGLAQHFDALTGASADETRSRKADVVAEALRRLRGLGADVSNPVLLGDRIHDVEGAAEHGVPTIAAAWGYGLPEEHADAIAVAKTPADALRLLVPQH